MPYQYWTSKDEVTIASVQDSEERALEVLNMVSRDYGLTHTGQATDLYTLDSGEDLAIGHYRHD